MLKDNITYANDFQSPTNRRYDVAQLLAAKILRELKLDKSEKLVEWFSDIDDPARIIKIGKKLRRQRI